MLLCIILWMSFNFNRMGPISWLNLKKRRERLWNECLIKYLWHHFTSILVDMCCFNWDRVHNWNEGLNRNEESNLCPLHPLPIHVRFHMVQYIGSHIYRFEGESKCSLAMYLYGEREHRTVIPSTRRWWSCWQTRISCE